MNPYYFDKYFLLIDDTSEMDKPTKAKVERMQKKLGSRYIELRKASLEDYYFNLNPQMAKDVKNEVEASKKNLKGLIKAKYSGKIVAEINDTETFSKLFDNELDFLIKKYPIARIYTK